MMENENASFSNSPPCDRGSPYILSSRELAQFKQQGFLKIEACVYPDDILEVRRIIDSLYASHQKVCGAIGGLLSLNLKLKDTTTYRSCLAIAKQILGRSTMYAGDVGLYKEPHGKHGTPWHQDGAFHGKYFPNNTIVFWIPFQDVSWENGCMHYIPLVKGQILLPHRRYYLNDYGSLMTDGVDAAGEVVCPLHVGGVTIHGPLTLHSAMVNSTDSIRRTWTLTFRPWGRWGFFAPSRLLHRVRAIRDRLL